MSQDLFKDVGDFHAKFTLLQATAPSLLTQRKLQERIEFMQEELDEFIMACAINPTTWEPDKERDQDLPGQADALVDLVYVALGTAQMLGLPWQELWNDVQRANMAKVRGTTHRGHAVDVTKPQGWVGPQGAAILQRHGFNRLNLEERDDTLS